MDLTKKQYDVLLALLEKGGSAFQSEIKPVVKADERNALIKLQLILQVPNEKKIRLAITDLGRDIAAQPHIAARAPGNRQADKHTLVLFALLGRGGRDFQAAIKPKLGTKDRAELEEAGLIQVSKQGRKTWIELTDKGWEHAASLPGAPQVERLSDDPQVSPSLLEKTRNLILFALLGKGGEAFQSEIKPLVTPSERTSMERAGLIRVGERDGKFWLELNDKGWDYAFDKLDAPLFVNPTAAETILQDWLARIKLFLAAKQMILADFFMPGADAPNEAAALEDETAAPPPAADGRSLPDRIRAAFLELTGGRLNTHVLLRDLRPRLADIERASLDQALVGMMRSREAELMRQDNRRELTQADHDSALNIAGEARHILWIKR